MGKSKEKNVSREAKVDKKLVLGVKKKQLKRRKDRGLDGVVESEGAAEHATGAEKGLTRSKKAVLVKQQQQKKKRHAKVKSSRTESDDVLELQTSNMDEMTPKLKKNKKKLKDSNPVGVHNSLSDSNDASTPKLKKKKKMKERKNSDEPNNAEEVLPGNQDAETPSAGVNQIPAKSDDMDIVEPEEVKSGHKNKTKKVKKSGKSNKKDKHASSKEDKLEGRVEIDTSNVHEIQSVDEDCSRGMKKWILEYKQKRPGLKILQERIDEFIIAHEEQQEQEKKEREARAAEDGWTVVVHHKGRKKTTDTETGTAVGSVSLVAMQEKMANKKPKEIAQNFYRFQKREAHINELAMLQSKFEQDKKRIHQLRAQRKFKPY